MPIKSYLIKFRTECFLDCGNNGIVRCWRDSKQKNKSTEKKYPPLECHSDQSNGEIAKGGLRNVYTVKPPNSGTSV